MLFAEKGDLFFPTRQIMTLWDRRKGQTPCQSISFWRAGNETQKSTEDGQNFH